MRLWLGGVQRPRDAEDCVSGQSALLLTGDCNGSGVRRENRHLGHWYDDIRVSIGQDSIQDIFIAGLKPHSTYHLTSGIRRNKVP